MLTFKAAQQAVRKIDFATDGRGMLVTSFRDVFHVPDITKPKAKKKYEALGVWGADYLHGGSQLVLSKGEEGIWAYPLDGGEGERLAKNSRILKCVCSPTEPVVIVYQASVY